MLEHSGVFRPAGMVASPVESVKLQTKRLSEILAHILMVWIKIASFIKNLHLFILKRSVRECFRHKVMCDQK